MMFFQQAYSSNKEVSEMANRAKDYFPMLLYSLLIMIVIHPFLNSNPMFFTDSNGVIVTKQDTWVAHGGGAYKELLLSNTEKALDASVNKGFTTIEVDICYTKDGLPVLSHGWDDLMLHLYNEEGHQPTYKEFMSFIMPYEMRTMDVLMLLEWLKENKNVRIITDIKDDNIKGLTYIARYAGDVQHRVIPQIFTFEEYEQVKDLGFEDVLLTLYKTPYSVDEVKQFINEDHPLYGLVINKNKVLSFMPELINEDLFVYAHTVNDLTTVYQLKEQGVKGFYTDYLFFKELD